MSPKVKNSKIDTLIVSDLHLGSSISRADKLEELLKMLDFKRLILLGDIFDNSDFNRLSEENWNLLALIRELANLKADPKSGNMSASVQSGKREVIWIRGNHDKRIADLMSYFAGAKVYDQYVWEFHDKRFLAMHGDLFDQFSLRESLVGRIGQQVYLLVQRFDKQGRHIVRFLDWSHASLRRVSERVANGAAEYAQGVQAQYVFCGHTHTPMEKVFDEIEPVHYYNVGCWTRSPSTFAVIDESGQISLESME